jgi:hypothetical protein
MTDVVIRAKIQNDQTERVPETAKDKVEVTRIHEPVPYTEFQSENGKPYTANYFQLGDKWDIFNEEIALIEDYIQRKVHSGEISNDLETVGKEIKKLERMNNLKDEPRSVIRIGTVASYIKFLNEMDGIKVNYMKYGN